ncbi:MAG: 3-deoxy-manno-octulosonate cytidylyltransferase [Candidatus Omnitrophota bacterium]|nr:MAG: 3-deoxy-manno-octulosonate cytidylyltransferase [Candidatus Omnitrophota bacterium]
MRAIGVIPARWKSSRFEGKVLANIMGKPMLQHVWERAKESKILEDLIIATDSERVMKTVEDFGGKAVYTSKDQPSGTDRITEVINPIDVEVVVNIQGDEPLIHRTMIDSLANALLEDKTIPMATVIKRIKSREEFLNPNVVKVVIDKESRALYFSRSPIPHYRGTGEQHRSILDIQSWFSSHSFEPESQRYYKHIGIYAYSKDFLFTYTNLPKSSLEEIEKLEQLRALENGYKIKTVETEFETIGVDTQEDLKKVERYLRGGTADLSPETERESLPQAGNPAKESGQSLEME